VGLPLPLSLRPSAYLKVAGRGNRDIVRLLSTTRPFPKPEEPVGARRSPPTAGVFQVLSVFPTLLPPLALP